MATLRGTFLSILALAAAMPVAAYATEPTPKKADTVRERGFSLPFDIKTEPDMKLRGTNIDPPGLISPNESKAHYFGLGLRRPLGEAK